MIEGDAAEFVVADAGAETDPVAEDLEADARVGHGPARADGGLAHLDEGARRSSSASITRFAPTVPDSRRADSLFAAAVSAIWRSYAEAVLFRLPQTNGRAIIVKS